MKSQRSRTPGREAWPPLYRVRGLGYSRDVGSPDPSGREPEGRTVVGEPGPWALCVLSLLVLYIRVSSWVLAPYVKVWCALAAQCV